MKPKQSFNFLHSSQKNISFNQLFLKTQKKDKKKSYENYRKKIIDILPEKIHIQQQSIKWRMKTDFPIVKILKFNRINKMQVQNFVDQQRKMRIQMMIQPILYTLNELTQIPIFKVLYLLRQALIATQRLCHIYGNFILKNSMVCVNFLNKCKLWHNSNFQINQPQFLCQNQAQSVQAVILLFKSKTLKSAISKKLYQQLQKCDSFFEGLQIVKTICLSSKIRVPSSFDTKSLMSSTFHSPKKYNSRPPSDRGKLPLNQKSQFLSPQLTKRYGNIASPKKDDVYYAKKERKVPSFFSNKNIKKFIRKDQDLTNEKSFPSFLRKNKLGNQENILNNINTKKSSDSNISERFPQHIVIESMNQEDECSFEIEEAALLLSEQYPVANLNIPRLSRNRKLQQELSISNVSLSVIENQGQNYKYQKVLHRTLDNTILLKRIQNVAGFVEQKVKIIDESFQDQH